MERTFWAINWMIITDQLKTKLIVEVQTGQIFYFNFIGIAGINRKIPHQIYYGWKHLDNLVKFVLRERMNQIPCNQLLRFWNKDNEKKSFLCNQHTE